MAAIARATLAEGEWLTWEGKRTRWDATVFDYDVDGSGKPLPTTVQIDLHGPGVDFYANSCQVGIRVPIEFLEALAEALPRLRDEAARSKVEWDRVQQEHDE